MSTRASTSSQNTTRPSSDPATTCPSPSVSLASTFAVALTWPRYSAMTDPSDASRRHIRPSSIPTSRHCPSPDTARLVTGCPKSSEWIRPARTSSVFTDPSTPPPVTRHPPPCVTTHVTASLHSTTLCIGSALLLLQSKNLTERSYPALITT